MGTFPSAGQTGAPVPTGDLGSPDGALTWAVLWGGSSVAPGSITPGTYDLPMGGLAATDRKSGTQVQSVDQKDAFFQLLGETAGAPALGNTDTVGVEKMFGWGSSAAERLAPFDNNADGVRSEVF
jgi:hypothetical protein